MKLIAVRHGQTRYNRDRLVQGQCPVPLNDTGFEQARLLAERLEKEKIDAIFSSDLKRAYQTTSEIAKFHKKAQVQLTPLLRERNLDYFEGVTIDEYRKKISAEGGERWKYRPPGGENYEDVMKRVSEFVEKIVKEYPDKTVLVVAHGGVIRALVGVVTGQPASTIYDMKVDNTSVTIFESDASGKLRLKILNSVEHLDGFEGEI